MSSDNNKDNVCDETDKCLEIKSLDIRMKPWQAEFEIFWSLW